MFIFHLKIPKYIWKVCRSGPSILEGISIWKFYLQTQNECEYECLPVIAMERFLDPQIYSVKGARTGP